MFKWIMSNENIQILKLLTLINWSLDFVVTSVVQSCFKICALLLPPRKWTELCTTTNCNFLPPKRTKFVIRFIYCCCCCWLAQRKTHPRSDEKLQRRETTHTTRLAGWLELEKEKCVKPIQVERRRPNWRRLNSNMFRGRPWFQLKEKREGKGGSMRVGGRETCRRTLEIDWEKWVESAKVVLGSFAGIRL